MKALLTALLILGLAGPVYGDWANGCIGTTEKTADSAAVAEAGYLCGIIIATDGTNAVTLDMYDNATAASGTNIVPTLVITTSASNRGTAIAVNRAISNGVYVDITTSGTLSYVVYYKPRD